jgi:hypothetical protein
MPNAHRISRITQIVQSICFGSFAMHDCTRGSKAAPLPDRRVPLAQGAESALNLAVVAGQLPKAGQKPLVQALGTSRAIKSEAAQHSCARACQGQTACRIHGRGRN